MAGLVIIVKSHFVALQTKNVADLMDRSLDDSHRRHFVRRPIRLQVQTIVAKSDNAGDGSIEFIPGARRCGSHLPTTTELFGIHIQHQIRVVDTDIVSQWRQIFAKFGIHTNALGRIHIQSLRPELRGGTHHFILYEAILVRRCVVRRQIIDVDPDPDGLEVLKVVPIIGIGAGRVPIVWVGIGVPVLVVPLV